MRSEGDTGRTCRASHVVRNLQIYGRIFPHRISVGHNTVLYRLEFNGSAVSVHRHLFDHQFRFLLRQDTRVQQETVQDDAADESVELHAAFVPDGAYVPDDRFSSDSVSRCPAIPLVRAVRTHEQRRIHMLRELLGLLRFHVSVHHDGGHILARQTVQTRDLHERRVHVLHTLANCNMCLHHSSSRAVDIIRAAIYFTARLRLESHHSGARAG